MVGFLMMEVFMMGTIYRFDFIDINMAIEI